MPKPIRLPDDPAPFRVWLESLPGEQVVGHSRTCGRCPLAEFLRHLGADHALVRDQYSTRRAGDPDVFRAMLPKWALNFAAMVDREGYGVPVTTEECLSLLEDDDA